ncbi:MAG: tRNA pseudouridine(38-40) synthase TruA [Candidatus Parabeggiatoa sp. nov. 3]|nr:MAG: tRNA pseudouridine(38-40) synthase TruA [Gammaproteobacteria bacterium]RKZ61689.1 MAG: tRNA pseudouridine(38-40) synthase TruA [Gammaproteobacteria bacterium]RKZ82991.1 MAG: tRNA pseudouridine(38-40) synthase TruA [Gammaproteobacteria bacterium]HEW98682.1 tRNA pseudouridine(38-40) synthase TruA [Beggiatoa sp.]
MRIALGIEYAGEHYWGWQIQPKGLNVQRYVEAALSKVANEPVAVVCAGRTDSGVHALEQIVHADVTVQRTKRSWRLGTNANLPQDISILWAQSVDEQFHARFSAQARHYRYVILNRPSRPALLAKRVTWEHQLLAVEHMQTAANYLIGTHDFTSYRAVACQAKNPIRTVSRLSVSRFDEQVIIDISANAFLHHMVRNIAGVLITIGRGEQPPEWARTVLEAKDRRQGGVTAPAYGLYFCRVDYPPPYQNLFPQAPLPKGPFINL